MNEPIFIASKLYAYVYIIFKKTLNLQIPGLGFLLRRCKKSTILKYKSLKIYFEPTVAASYGLHIIGLPQEPETHNFLNFVFNNLKNEKIWFIDIGANIGIFMADLAKRSNTFVIGFEPSKGCVKAIKKTMLLNGFKNFEIFSNLVGNKNEFIPYSQSLNPETDSVFNSLESSEKIQQIKIDDVRLLSDILITEPVIMLIDVEGYELNVLLGATNFISKYSPLIVFEYNNVSKKYFSIEQVFSALGTDYNIFRLRDDSMLDKNINRAWNCVAITNQSIFYPVITKRIHVD